MFVIRSNGILPTELQPLELQDQVRVRGNGGWSAERRIEALAPLSLPEALAPLEAFRDRLTILQGLSGRMCDASHNAGFGALGAYKSKGETPPIAETVDAALARDSDRPFPHLGLALDHVGPQIVYPPLSAAGAYQALPYYADPATAYRDLFGSALSGAEFEGQAQVRRLALDFLTRDLERTRPRLPEREQEKLDHYRRGFDALDARAARLAAMRDELAAAAPTQDARYESLVETERLEAHFELAAAALIGGLTDVVAIRAEHLGMRLTGLGLGSKTVHHMGHMIEGKSGGNGGESFENGMGEFATRAHVLRYHMELIAGLARALQAAPEGDGSVLDQTLVVYLSDHGDRHHSKFYEWPLLTLGDAGGRLRAGHLLQLPGYAQPEHRTIGHFYVSLLRAAGRRRETFGEPDRTLPATIEQRGPLPEWMV